MGIRVAPQSVSPASQHALTPADHSILEASRVRVGTAPVACMVVRAVAVARDPVCPGPADNRSRHPRERWDGGRGCGSRGGRQHPLSLRTHQRGRTIHFAGPGGRHPGAGPGHRLRAPGSGRKRGPGFGRRRHRAGRVQAERSGGDGTGDDGRAPERHDRDCVRERRGRVEGGVDPRSRTRSTARSPASTCSRIPAPPAAASRCRSAATPRSSAPPIRST